MVDTMDNTFAKTFGAWPERFFVVERGKVTLMGQPTTEWGYDRLVIHSILQRRQELVSAREESKSPDAQALAVLPPVRVVPPPEAQATVKECASTTSKAPVTGPVVSTDAGATVTVESSPVDLA